MNVRFLEKDKLLLFELTEEIDHHHTEEIRRKMDYEIERYMPKKVIFNFNRVSFMDSAGIGLLLGRYKLVRILGGECGMIAVKDSIKKVFEMSGILKIIPIHASIEWNWAESSEAPFGA